jgi:ATP-binding cassette subfamily C protein EexD
MMFQSLMLGLGGYLAINMEVSPGMMIAGSIIMGRALAPLDLLVGTWKGFSGARTSYRRLNDLLEEFPAQKDAMKLPDPKGEVTLENLVVVPPKAKKPSIMGLNMQINKGDIVGIIGPSAAGKSSLARALLGLWPLQNGKARIDKADISQWRREDLGKFIGYLPQDIELFEGTVAQNIARFDEVDSDKVVKAAQLAGVHEMILKLPDGYDSYISSASLSGGQKQRIGLARALYGDPVLVVLDEPNSNLDEAVEQALLQAVEQMKQNNTTVILITHKRNILRATSKLAFMVEGKLQMFGPTQNVLAKLAQKQNQGGQMQKNPQGQKNQGQNPNANAQQLRKPGEEQ